jgi:3-dehydroquinate synthase
MPTIKFQTTPVFHPAPLKQYSRIAVLVDSNTRRLCYPLIQKQLPAHDLIEVPAGEEHKNLVTCQIIWQHMTELALDRHSLLIVVGGGVLGDMGGFCAATFKRGIDFLLVPTTLLAQVDASVGGKLGVDFGPYKNHIGVFQQPISTQIASGFLTTLPKRELRSGFAEIIKHCIIGDKRMWEKVRKHRPDEQPWLSLIKHSVQFKRRVVDLDPREKGLRKILNFGHTIGHAIEGHFLTTDNRLFHGEAIAAGMIVESFIARQKKFLSIHDQETICDYLRSVFGKVSLPPDAAWQPLLKQDKKNKGNTILMALPKPLGKAVWDVPVSDKEIRLATDYYRSL